MSDEWKRGYKISDIINYEADQYTLEKVITRVVSVLLDNPSILKSCPRIEFEDTDDITCPYYIKAPIFRDCSLIANHFGPFTVEEISIMMNEDPKRINRLISSGLKKMQKQMKKGQYL